MNSENWDQANIEAVLAGLPLGKIDFFPSVTSTNTVAASLADKGAPDLSLVVAGQQTAGKGREGRKWFSPPDASLAFSLALKPPKALTTQTSLRSLLLRYNALGALAVCDTFESLYQIKSEIKWPNDILIERRKVCGVLSEAHWLGNELVSIILGIGINVNTQAIPPESELFFPATSVQEHFHQPISRLDILRQFIHYLILWRSRIGNPDFIDAWESRLAFRQEWIIITNEISGSAQQDIQGKLVGLNAEGQLVLEDQSGAQLSIQFGELRLRPAQRKSEC